MSSATSATWLLSIACSEIPVLCPTSGPKRQRFGCCCASAGSGVIGAESEKRDAPAAVEVRLRDEVLHPVKDLLEQGALEKPRLEHGGVCCGGGVLAGYQRGSKDRAIIGPIRMSIMRILIILADALRLWGPESGLTMVVLLVL